MPAITFDEAWAAYRRAERRCPAPPPPTRPLRIDGVRAVAEEFDVVVLDAWGVLNLGPEPLPGARDAVLALRRAGKRVRTLSNDATSDKPASRTHHARRGFAFTAEEMHAGLDLLPQVLNGADLGRIGIIGVAPYPRPDLTRRMRPLRRGAQADEIDTILFLASDDWEERDHAWLHDVLSRRARPLIVGNPDIASPLPQGLWAEPGWFAHRLADDLNIAPLFLGKPFGSIYERLLADLEDVPPHRILCVGDTPHTDILGARAAGCRALLVESGFCRGRDTLALCAESGIWPDFIARSL